MSKSKSLFVIFTALAALCFTSCEELLQEDLPEDYSLVTATETDTWNYSSTNQIYQVGPTVKTVNIKNVPANKTLYLVKRNKGAYPVAFEHTRTIENAGRAVLSSENTSAAFEDFSFDDNDSFTREHYQSPSFKELKNLSKARTVQNDSGSSSSAVVNYNVGDTKTLFVDVHLNPNEYEEKTATLSAKGEYCYVWIVNDYLTTSTASGKKANTTAATKIQTAFDNIYPMIRNIFGEESEYIIRNGRMYPIENYSPTGSKVNIVLYDINNDYVQNQSSGVLGYFSSKDYIANTNLSSNFGKYFYIDSGFLNSRYGETISTLAHEFQHMINFNMKDLKTDDQGHDLGLDPSAAYNEMLSLLCEDMMQSYLGLTDSESPKGRFLNFNTKYYKSGISEYNNSDSVYSYATNFAFGSYLARQYGGAELVATMSQNNYVDNTSIVEAVKEYTETTTYTYDKLFMQFLLALTGSSTYTHNKNGNCSDYLYYNNGAYKYPMTAFNIFDSAYTVRSTMNSYASFVSYASNNAYSKYIQNSYKGPFIYKTSTGPDELRPDNGISIHGVKTTSLSTETIEFSETGADTVYMYLIIQ